MVFPVEFTVQVGSETTVVFPVEFTGQVGSEKRVVFSLEFKVQVGGGLWVGGVPRRGAQA